MWQYNYIYAKVSDDELMHYGVLGMKWGIRKARTASAETARSKIASIDEKNRKLREKQTVYKTKAANRKAKAERIAFKAMKKESSAWNKKGLEKAQKLKFKAKKERINAEKIDKKVQKIDATIFRNGKVKEAYNSRLSELSETTIATGKELLKKVA